MWMGPLLFLRVPGDVFSFIIHVFSIEIPVTNSVDSDQVLHSVASEQSLRCLHNTLKGVAGLWVKPYLLILPF